MDKTHTQNKSKLNTENLLAVTGGEGRGEPARWVRGMGCVVMDGDWPSGGNTSHAYRGQIITPCT